MSTIDEVMKQADNYARSWADAQTSEIGHRGTADVCCDADQSALREMIAAALEDARRDGAEQMREAAADRIEACDQETERWEYAEHVRALPLQTGERQAVLLTDEQIIAAVRLLYFSDEIAQQFHADDINAARAIEAAVLAANGLEVRRG